MQEPAEPCCTNVTKTHRDKSLCHEMLNVVMQIEAAAPQQSQHIDVFHVWMCVQVALFSQHATHWKECMLGVQQKPSGGSQMVVLQWRLVVIRHSKFMLRPDQEVIVHTTMEQSTLMVLHVYNVIAVMDKVQYLAQCMTVRLL